MVDLSRRHFIKILGIGSLAFAPGCSSRPEKNLFSYVQAPEDMVTGKATWYASTCRECPAGCGILAKNREGRVIKVEGNPLHPINRGKLCMRGQAAVQGVYNPDRIRKPLLKKSDGWQTLSFREAEALLKQKIDEAARKGQNGIHMLTDVVGQSLSTLLEEALQEWKSQPPLVFEPFAYESLKTANQKAFGLDGLPSYKMEDADFLVSFGADFLETWLSPVEYARKFKKMHAIDDGKKGLCVHVGPYQSLTCANADLWLSCTPGSEIVVGLGLIREALQGNRGNDLSVDLRSALREISSSFTKEKVTELSGVDPDLYASLVTRLHQARKPLILGTGTGDGANSVQVNVAANALNALLDPQLTLLNFHRRHLVETAARRSEVLTFLQRLRKEPDGVLLLNNVNPVFALPSSGGAAQALKQDSLFSVSFSNFMDETTQLANLIFPVKLPLETWDEYSGTSDIVSMVQPTMAGLTGAPHLGDVFLRLAYGEKSPAKNFQEYLSIRLFSSGAVKDQKDWVNMLQEGGLFEKQSSGERSPQRISGEEVRRSLGSAALPRTTELTFFAAPSVRFFDGRGANRPWLCEVPDPLTKVAWQSPVSVNPQTLTQRGLKQGDVIELKSQWGTLEAPAYETEGVRPGVLLMSLGQGHEKFGRYAEGMGTNPVKILPPQTEPVSGSPPLFAVSLTSLRFTGRSLGSAPTEKNKGFPAQFGIYYRQRFAHTDGSKVQHGRKIALSVNLHDLGNDGKVKKEGYGMWDFPLVLPLPEGYDKKRDIYPPHDHQTYRWAMVVDLDRCIGCNACAAACYAENNVGIVGPDRIREGREMAWLSIERYLDEEAMTKVTFLPMLCQHCDNAPCESVCPVFAPNHSKEGLNNQIFNRCIGTRFCSQNCPYKVRRFNWFDWKWPEPLHLQLNPDVTVRSKGVMEKCSFCVQRIKDAHGVAKDEKREIRDGEVQPACVQTCPTKALIFGNLMDQNSRVRRLTADPRAYQVMGYLNTKPAVIYLKKVVQET
jgi:anaerobic selenocysteine-containing dehydrogenase/Fe-S-cluster-containing dehydrogenase component